MRSQAAPEILQLCHRVNQVLPCPLLFGPVGGQWEYMTNRPKLVRMDDLTSVIMAMRWRIKEQVIALRRETWGKRLCRVPLTPEEVKLRVKARYEKDEAKMLPLLSARGSVSGTLFTEMNLTRGILSEAMARLNHSRALQSTLGSIVCATRFKYFQGARLLQTECAYCGQVDSFTHLLSCVNIGQPPRDSEELVGFLVELADRAYNVNPGNPRPVREGGGVELELVPSEDEVDANGGAGWLEVEDDTVEPFDVQRFFDDLPETAPLEVELSPSVHSG